MRPNPARRMRRALSTLLANQPFFGHLALRMPLKADMSRQTIASDGVDIRFNPKWVAETPSDQIRAAIAHCVLACSSASPHASRRTGLQAMEPCIV